MDTINTNKRTRISIRQLTIVPLMTVISYLLAFFEMSIPIIPSFIKMDVSDVPALMGSFALGPFSGLLIELLKNMLGLFSTSTMGIGELSNFILNGIFVGTAGLIYKKKKTKKTAIKACFVAVLVRGAVSIIVNYYIMFPIYEKFMPINALIESFSEYISFIDSKWDIMLYSIFPFNLIKGAINCLLTMLIYKRVSPIIKGEA